MSIQSQVVLVTPEKAKTWLEKGGKNRVLRIAHARDLAEIMEAGRWVLNGQSISFDKDGKLLDGQHRLYAITITGIPLLMLIVTGIDDARAFETYDTAIRKRDASQILTIEGIKNASPVAAISRRLAVWDKTMNKHNFTLKSDLYFHMNTIEVVDSARAYLGEIIPIYDDLRYSAPYRNCRAGSSLIAAVALCNRIDDVATMLFVEGLKMGANLDQHAPALMLRERLMSPPERRGGLGWENEVMALTIKSWNKFRTGKDIKNLKWIQDGPRPEPFPIPGER